MTYWYKKSRQGAIKRKIYSFLINLERELIYRRCELRFDNMLKEGALEEVKKIHNLILIDHSQLQSVLELSGC